MSFCPGIVASSRRQPVGGSAIASDYTNLTSWYDASQDSFANNDPVNTLIDRSGNGRNLPAGGTSPTFKTNIFPSGKPGIDFTANFMGSGAHLDVFLPTTAHSSFAVFTIDSFTTDNANYWQNAALLSENTANFAIAFRSSTGILVASYDTAIRMNTHAASINTPYILHTRHDGSTLYSSLNGGTELSVSFGTRAGSGDIRFGTNNDASLFADIKVGEFFTYSVARSGAEVSALINGLKTKWSIP